ncbi:MAG: hypothetical protein AAB467_00075 [Patescibacteria group bacterium]
MNNYNFENVTNLLNKIFIFDQEYKDNILSRVSKLDPVELTKLHDLLFEVESWQRAAFEEKLKNDPTVMDKLNKLISSKNDIVKKMQNVFHADKDQKKMTKVLSYIDKL